MNNNILTELVQKQIKNVDSMKLLFNDIQRLNNYLSTSIFSETECSIWNGNISTINNNSYILFYLNKKKYPIQRILYNNYIGNINDSEYIKFKCNNKGICCNINHFHKVNDNVDKN